MTPILPIRNQLARPPRTGVVICECGGKISRVLDTESLRLYINQLNEVFFTASEPYPCSRGGQERLRQAITDLRLERVVIAGCTPRLVEKLFQKAIRPAGLNQASLEVVDIREQCAWVHPAEPGQALEKAASLIECGVARMVNRAIDQNLEPRFHERVVKAALVVGSSLSGLATTQELARAGIRVTLVEPRNQLGKLPPWADELMRNLVRHQVETIGDHSQIIPLLNARLVELSGGPGNYQVVIAHSGQTERIAVGAILVAGEARPQALGVQRWFDRQRVKTQEEFEAELRAGVPLTNVVMIFSPAQAQDKPIGRLACLNGIRQAIQVRQVFPQAAVTILFRELPLGRENEAGQEIFKKARDLGVTFFRCGTRHPPVVNDQTIDLFDPLTDSTIQLPYERVVLAMPLAPEENATHLAAMLHLPQDNQGFLIEPRIRLRPGRFADDGIFVLGGSHQPVNLHEALFQAYLTSTRVIRFLSQETISSEASTAQVEPNLCTGCGECAQVCMAEAIHLEIRALPDISRSSVLSLSTIDPLRCTGCGNCAVACPVKAIVIPGWEDAAILEQISTALRPRSGLVETPDFTQPAPPILALACEWSAYAAADLAGARHLEYPASVRILRMNCSARFDPNHILWAFLNGARGVFLGACPLGECHYGSGNHFAQERTLALQQQLAEHGIDPGRLQLEMIAADDGPGFVKAIQRFAIHLASSTLASWEYVPITGGRHG